MYLIPDFKVGMVPNVGIVVGTRGALVIDPGMGMKNGQVVLREVQKVSKGSEIYIVNTHFHPEHTTGEVAFPPEHQGPARDGAAAGRGGDGNEVGRACSPAARLKSRICSRTSTFRAPAETFEKEKVLDLGGVRVRIIRLGPGHTRGDTVTFVEGDGVLFSGDLAMKGLFPAFCDAAVAQRYLAREPGRDGAPEAAHSRGGALRRDRRFRHRRLSRRI